MAAISAAGVQRQMANVNGRPTPASASQNPVGGTTPGSFIGGIPSSYNQPGGFPGAPHDTTSSIQFNPTTFSSQPSAQAVYPPQPNTNTPSNPSVNPSMSQPNFAAQEVAKQQQRQRNFLVGLANVHVTRGTPLPPALTGVPYPASYDPTNSPWKSLDCPPGQYGVVRMGGKDIDLLRMWGLVCQVGGWPKVSRLFILCYCRMLNHSTIGHTTAGLDTNCSPI